MQNYLNRIPNYVMLGQEFYSNQQTKTFCYVSIHLRSHINNSSSCLTGISKHSKTMYENTRASRSSYIVFSCLNIPVKRSILLFIYYFKNSLIIHEENTKKNHKRVVSLYVIHNVYFENYFPMNLARSIVLKQFKTFAVRVLSDLNC